MRGARIDFKRVAGDDLETAGICSAISCEGGNGALVALDRNDAARPLRRAVRG